MDGFSDRKKAFETKFSRDEEAKFRAIARRNRMLGLWAAGLMGKTSDEAETYALEVLLAFLEVPHDEHIVNKLSQDLQAGGQDISHHRITKELEKFHVKAHEMIGEDETR